MRDRSEVVSALRYDADLIGNITQVLAGLQGYETMALELLQNADDAGAAKVRFDLRNDRLIITHDSEFSSCGLETNTCPWRGETEGRRCDFHGISLMASAGKARDAGQIGRFGIGFVSVYQVTDRPTLTSAGIALTLDPYTRDNVIVRLATEAGTRIDLPWASSYSPTRKALQTSPVPSDICELVLAALTSVCREGLLFLRNLTEIEIARSGNTAARFSIERGDKDAVVTSPRGVDRWLVLKAEADPSGILEQYEQLGDLQRSTEVRVAFAVGATDLGPGRLYAYLPTGQASGLPCHIQADFFPRQDRRSIVTTGGSHERAFNLLLIDAAADLIARHLVELRDALGAEALWALIDAAYSHRKGDAPLDLYWPSLESALETADVALTISGGWLPARKCLLPPAEMPSEEEAAVHRLELPLVDETLRPRRNLFQALGARPISLTPVVDALAALGATSRIGLAPFEGELVGGLWALVDRLLATDKSPDHATSRIRLMSAYLVADRHGRPATINALYRSPEGMTAAQAAEFIPDAPVIHDAVRAYPGIWALTDELTLEVAAQQLADARATTETVDDEEPESADDTPGHLGRLIDWLASFPAADPAEEVRDILRDVPLLPCGGEVLPSSRALWPGGFTDPIGHLRLVDTTVFGPAAAAFVKSALGVEVLTFRRYLEEHLEAALASEPNKAAYLALIREILRLEHELHPQDMAHLGRARLCRTEGGAFVRTADAYQRTEKHEALLGLDHQSFLDRSWLGGPETEARVVSLFERLGLGREISVEHLADRLIALAANDPTSALRDTMSTIVRHILERADKWSDSDLASIRRLADHAWAPGALNGEALLSWSRPDALQRPFRTETFLSQAALIDLPALRGHRSAQQFLDLVGAPAEPPTSAVVAHLLFLAQNGRAPMESVYAVLSERLDRDRAAVLELLGEPIVWHPAREAYFAANQLFWSQPPLRTYWAKATAHHARHDALFRALGVEDEPSPASYGRLLKQIAAAHPDGLKDRPNEALTVALVWNALAAGLGDLSGDARDILVDLKESAVFLTHGLSFQYFDEVVWCDVAKLAEPFGESVDRLLVAPPATNAALLYRLLDVSPLSEVVVLTASLVENPRPNAAAHARLKERGRLLAWLAPTAETSRVLAEVASTASIFDVDALTQRAEFAGGPAEIVSPSTSVNAFFDPAVDSVYARPGPNGSVDWSSIFHALLPSLFRGEPFDLPKTILSAILVLNAASEEEAELALRGSGLEPHESWVDPDGSQPDEAEGDRWSNEAEPEAARWPESPEEVDVAPGDDVSDAPEFGEPAPDAPSSGEPRTSAGPMPAPGPGTEGSGRNPGDRGPRPTVPQTQRLRSYVSREREQDQTANPGSGSYDNPIDEGAMQAALDFERRAGRLPERQTHTNPGFDIVSTDPATGAKRVIEVKGLAGEWNARGVKLSPTQFATAERHGDDFWLYVVERAEDVRTRLLTPLMNPFAKVEEFWFDDLWKEQAEAPVAAKDLAFTAGRRVRHKHFGTGILESVRKRGMVNEAVVAFADGTRKNLLISKDLEVLVD